MPLPTDPGPISAEFRLLAACSWLPPPPFAHAQAATIAELCASPVDWDAFVALVRRHRVPVLVHEALRRFGGVPPPPELPHLARQSVVQALGLWAALKQLSPLFRMAEIPMLPLKGPALSLRLFNTPTHRTLRDLDLWVPLSYVHQADALLRTQGYVRMFPGFEPSRRMRAALYRDQHHFCYQHAEQGFCVELHWRLHAHDALPWETFWTMAQTAPPSCCLPDGPLFLLLCSHGSKHQWFRLKWLSDVAMLLATSQQLHEATMAAMAKAWGLEASVAQTCRLLETCYGLPVPPWVQALHPALPHTEALAALGLQALLAPWDGHPGLLHRHRSRMHYLRLLGQAPSWRRYVGSLLLAPGRTQPPSLPNCFFWLYTLICPLLWLWDRAFSAHDSPRSRAKPIHAPTSHAS